MTSTAPATVANIARNARAEIGRHARWQPARDALWTVLDPLVVAGARVAVAGAGNADSVPLRRLAGRADDVVLIDLDRHAAQSARRRLPRALRRRVRVEPCDVTGGAADALASGTAVPPLATGPLPGAPYDVVVGDLLYSQLLYPALVDLGIDAGEARARVAAHAPALTRALVLRLHASAPGGTVVHVHDPLAWWDGHEQPVRLAPILAAAPQDAARMIEHGRGPHDSDPIVALRELGLPVLATALWRWPFLDGVDYLVRATVSATPTARP